MRRAGLALALTCTALVSAAPAAARERAPAAVDVAACQPADSDTRSAAFRARMRTFSGTRTMEVRFYLLERLGDGRFRRVRGPGLGRWRSSRPGARRFVYTQRIEGLKARAEYRVVVHHRWLDADGEQLRFARRRSDVCEVEGALPNLTIVKIARRDGLYSVVIRNSGAAGVSDVPVTLSVDGIAIPAVTLPNIGALQTRTVRFDGPPCAAGVSAAVDPANAVRESSESDNVLALRCRRG